MNLLLFTNRCKLGLKAVKCLFFVFFMGLAVTAFGQINLKVGYNFTYSNLEQTKRIFDRFNADNPQAEQLLSPPRSYHGIELGLRYRYKNIAIDAGISSVGSSTDALNVFQKDGTLGNDEWRMSIVNYSIGLESYFGTLGLGATIGTQRLKYSTDFASASENRSVLFEESVLASRFYLIIEVPSKSVAFSIRPYISTTWTPYNIQGVELAFEPQSNRPASEFEQDLFSFGLAFLFFNGPQRRR